MLVAGSVIAGYRVERVLGTGRMGTVYLARSPDLPRNDALKVLNSDLSHNDDFQVRFLHEADVAAQLSHPNIVTVYRRGTSDEGLLWIAMQFVDGTDAETALRAGRMTPIRAIHIVTEIAKALDYAHRRHVIHRDVKPANFLLSDDSDTDERVLLGDFGIAHSMAKAQAETSGSVLATVAYAAPEVLYGKAIDGRADIYSLGCSLFRLLTGRTPFPGDGDTATVIRGHLHEPPPRVTDYVSDLPREIDTVIAKALAKDPANRYQTGQEFVRAATEALHSTSPAVVQPAPVPDVSAPPAGPVPVAVARTSPDGGGGRRSRWLLAAAGVGIAALAVGIAVIAWPRGPSSGDAADLGTLFVSDAALESILDESVRTSTELTDPVDHSASLPAADRECAAVLGPAARSIYADSGYTGLQIRQSSAGGSTRQGDTTVEQAVISYPTGSAATEVAERQRGNWERCGMSRLARTTNPAAALGVSDVADAGEGISYLAVATGPTRMCGRALTTRENLVMDTMVCRTGDTGVQVVDVVRAIAERV